MKTPSKKEVKAYFKNAKEVRCLFDKEIYDISKWTRFFDNEDGSFWVEKAEKTSDQAELFDNGKYAEIISYKEKTHQISETLLKKLAENNSFSEELIKKECPKLFPAINYGVYLKCRNNPLWLCYYDKGIKYGFDAKGIWFKENSGYQLQLTDYIAKPQEIETAFKDLFIKLGFVKGKVFKCLGTNREITIKNPDLDFDNFKTDNIIYIDDYQVFNNGKLATIIETPNDIITIVEKYGKDKIQDYLNNAK